jgi:hypothetical protein
MRRTLLVLAALSIAAPALPLPRIHEVFYDAEGSDRASVFTELFGLPGAELDGWMLVGIDGSTGLPYRTISLAGAVVPDDGLLVIATARALGDLLLTRDFIGDVDWQNGPDAVQLWDPVGAVADALQYGESVGFAAGEGLPAPDVLPGWSLTRDRRSTDTGDNRADFAAGAPTPGVMGGAEASVPEPAEAMLLFAGLLAALAQRVSLRTMMSNPWKR